MSWSRAASGWSGCSEMLIMDTADDNPLDAAPNWGDYKGKGNEEN